MRHGDVRDVLNTEQIWLAPVGDKPLMVLTKDWQSWKGQLIVKRACLI